VFQFSTPTETSEITTAKEIISTIVHEQELSVEPEINTKDKPHELVDKNGDFTSLAVDSVLQVDKGEKKFVLDSVSISDSAAEFVEKQKQDVTESRKNSIIATTMPSTEKEVVLSVTVAETTQQHPFFIFQLPDFPIELLDPGGSTTAFSLNPQDFVVFDPGGDEHRVRSLKAKFGNDVYVFDPGGDDRFFGSPVLISINNHDTPSLLQIPWDRGKSIVYDFVISFKLFNWFTPVRSNTPPVTIFDSGGDMSGTSAISGGSLCIFSLLWLPRDRGKDDWNCSFLFPAMDLFPTGGIGFDYPVHCKQD
jgi:hypothetical protein